jgi:DNA-binding NarL/FixJ family response regulator
VKLNTLKNEIETRREPLCLWLADDDHGVRTLVAEVLTKDGALRCDREFACAENVIAALESGGAPDVIVLDVNMGGMTGIEAIPSIKALSRSTSVFIMTTFYDSAKESDALNAGASGFFVKTECHGKMEERILASAEAARAGTEFEGRNAECVATLRVSAPGRLY